MLLTLGDFQFSVETAPFESMQISISYPWSKVDRIQNEPTFQATAKSHFAATLNGVYFPGYRAKGTIPLLKELQEMKPLPLTGGNGNFYGLWVVVSFSETNSIFFDDGTPRKVEFTISLERFNE